MKKIFCMLLASSLIFSLFATSCGTGGPQTKLSRRYGGSEDDWAYSVQQTSDGGYIIAGWTESYGAGGKDFWLYKTDEGGGWQWDRTFGGNATDEAHSVQQTSDGGYIIAGWTASDGAGEADFWLIKTDDEGKEEGFGNQTFGGAEDDWAESVQQTSDGGYIIAGCTESYGAGGVDGWLVKTDDEGNEEWVGKKTFGGAEDDWANSVQQTSDGGYIIAGCTVSDGAGGGDFWLVKTDDEGEEDWSQTFGGPFLDWAWSVQQTSDGGYIIAGVTMPGDAGWDFWIVKTNDEGGEEWNKTFGGVADDRATSVQQTSDGGYIIVGWTASDGAGGEDIWIVKTDGGGGEEWDKTFGGPHDDEAWSVQQTSDGGYVIAGWTASWTTGGMDFWLIGLR